MVRKLVEKELGYHLGDTVYDLITGDAGVVVGFEVIIDQSGELMKPVISFSPSLCRDVNPLTVSLNKTVF